MGQLKPMSDKKAAQLAEEGVRFPHSTLRQVSPKRAAERVAAGKSPLARSAPRDTGPDEETVAGLFERDGWRCGKCGGAITGTRGWDWSVSHRRPRRAGGDPRPDTNLPSNLELLHGSATTLCHGDVESHRGDAYLSGHLLHDGDVPSQEPVNHAVHGWVYLTDDGRVEQAPPPVNRAGVLDLGGYWDEDGTACA